MVLSELSEVVIGRYRAHYIQESVKDSYLVLSKNTNFWLEAELFGVPPETHKKKDISFLNNFPALEKTVAYDSTVLFVVAFRGEKGTPNFHTFFFQNM